eukprot:6187066-Pleurochrysis_carterae.AAC.4
MGTQLGSSATLSPLFPAKSLEDDCPYCPTVLSRDCVERILVQCLLAVSSQDLALERATEDYLRGGWEDMWPCQEAYLELRIGTFVKCEAWSFMLGLLSLVHASDLGAAGLAHHCSVRWREVALHPRLRTAVEL